MSRMEPKGLLDEAVDAFNDGVFYREEGKKNLIRGRFSYTGPGPERGQLRYWINNTDKYLNAHERHVWVPPMPTIVKEKMALLDMSGRGERVPGVGKKQSTLVYYLHFTPREIQQMESEHEELCRNAGSDGLGNSQSVSKT